MIPQFKPYLGKPEVEKLTECIDDNWITGGKKVAEFERRFRELTGANNALTCSNGTTALYLGLLAMGIGEGDEVIVPDFTFIASANAVVWTGAKPVFCDVRRDTMNLDPDLLGKARTNKTKAIMPVHIYGQSCAMDDIMEFAQTWGLNVIEDAAQGVKVTYNGKHTGTFGNVGTLSFYADKTMTTGEGGMVLTNCQDLADSVTMLMHQGRKNRGIYYHERVGYNFRMTDLQAAIGLAQLDKLDYIVKRKKELENLYRSLLGNNVDLPYIDPKGFNVPFRINVLADNPYRLEEYLKSKGVGSMRFFYPLHRQPCYMTGGDFPVSDWLFAHGLSLPSFVELKDEQVEDICKTINRFYEVA